MSGAGVFVTGLGVVSPHGNDPGQMFDQLMRGRSAVHLHEEDGLPPAAVASVDFDPLEWFTRLQLAGVDRVSQLAVAAAESARSDAGWADQFDPLRIGVFVGSGMGGAGAIDHGYTVQAAGKRVPPLTVVASMTNAPAAHVAMRCGAHGPVYTYSVACASSAVAIAEAAKAIQAGEIDIAMAGGSEALLVPGVIRAWQALQTLAPPDAQDPAASCRPFSEDRSGFVLAEGAAMLVLESERSVRGRGAKVYARWMGSGTSCDASHLTKPDVAGQTRALRQALLRSGLSPSQIGYCNAHGTATRVGDVAECEALRAVWGDDLPSLQVSSTKSMHGHLLGGAGALEAAIVVLALHRQQLPPTANSRRPDPACAVPIIRDQGCEVRDLQAAVSSSFAFGGTNVVLAFRAANGSSLG
jgi:3-oxoacyl-[acyl-carrier-protein] synthase II